MSDSSSGVLLGFFPSVSGYQIKGITSPYKTCLINLMVAFHFSPITYRFFVDGSVKTQCHRVNYYFCSFEFFSAFLYSTITVSILPLFFFSHTASGDQQHSL